MRHFIKTTLNRICQFIIIPLAIPCKLEEWFLSPHAETVFHTCTHLVALLPGLPGVFLRRAFYSLTLERCSLESYIGFGTLFSHRAATVEEHVYIGNYSMIGSAHLGAHCLIGSRVSILSGKTQHVLDKNGMWTPFSPEKMTKVSLAGNVWVGEGAIIMADVGDGSMVGAGAVITSNVRSHIIVGGNPARFVRNLLDDAKGASKKEESTQ
jgi:virginiamycin A acetyltransferase